MSVAVGNHRHVGYSPFATAIVWQRTMSKRITG